MALFMDRGMVDAQDVQELVQRINELENAAAATLHVNQLLNQEVERCVRGMEAAQVECQAWKDRAKWLSMQLIKAKKGQAPADEAQALVEMLNRYDTRQPEESGQDQGAASTSTSGESQATKSQAQLIKKLTERGLAANWLIDPREVELGHVLGKGEFGVTYQAQWRGSTVAVKVVRVLKDKERMSFLREVEALAALRHPHVLPFLGACMMAPDHFWLLTELMPGGTLAEWLHPQRQKHKPVDDASWGSSKAHQPAGAPWTGPPGPHSQPPSQQGPTSAAGTGAPSHQPKPFLERVRMAYEVAQGLQALEAVHPPLLHRDVKPSNIFIDGAGHARVGDLGLSRRLISSDDLANLTGETGTYLYMAPEVMRHEVYDSKADVWSWGVLFVEAMSGKMPYTGTYMLPEQIALGVAAETLRPEIPDSVNTDLQVVAHMCLAFHPDERPAFDFITQQLAVTYNKLLGEQRSQGGVPHLLSAVSKQLTSTWVGLLGRIYNTTAAPNGPRQALTAAAAQRAASGIAEQSSLPLKLSNGGGGLPP